VLVEKIGIQNTLCVFIVKKHLDHPLFGSTMANHIVSYIIILNKDCFVAVVVEDMLWAK